MDEFLDGSEDYTPKHLKQNLQDHYGNEMVITKKHGKDTVSTFSEMSHRILRANYHQMGLSKENIIDTAAILTEDEIRIMVCDTSKYPKFPAIADSDLVPPLLLQLQSGIMNSKAKVQNTAKRRHIAISPGPVLAILVP